MSKKKEIPQPAPQLPKIYRFITERFKKSEQDFKISIVVFAFGAIATFVVLAALDLTASLRSFNSLRSQRQTLLSQVNYWQKVVDRQPGYRDGYFMLAVLEYQLKDFDKSKEYLKKVVAIDPIFAPAQDLQKAFK